MFLIQLLRFSGRQSQMRKNFCILDDEEKVWIWTMDLPFWALCCLYIANAPSKKDFPISNFRFLSSGSSLEEEEEEEEGVVLDSEDCFGLEGPSCTFKKCFRWIYESGQITSLLDFSLL